MKKTIRRVIGIAAGISALVLLGSIGGMETGCMSLGRGILFSCIALSIIGLAVWIDNNIA